MHTRPLRLPLATAILLAILCNLGCSQEDPAYEHLYTTRAIVLSLPGDKVTQEFIVHHETIPDYISINGSIGMNEMAMPIPVPDKSILKNIAVGDKIQLTFGERFEPTHKMGLISATKLPADTKLNLSNTSRP